jgi:hypothetical protein
MFRSYQSIRPDPKYLRMFRGYVNFSCEELPFPQARGPSLVECRRLLIQNIRRSPPIGSRSFFRNPRTRRAVVTGTLLSAMESLNDSDDIKRAWENIKENIKTSAKDSLVL